MLNNMIQKSSTKKKKGFVQNIESLTRSNHNYRKVLYTGSNLQLVIMTLLPGEEIGEEVHKDHDQFFRIESGKGKVLINNFIYDISDGDVIIVPKGANHNIINTGKKGLKLYTIYAPPEHKDQIIHRNKIESLMNSKKFDGKLTER